MFRILNKFSSIKDTCLKDLHLANNGRMVVFAGYNMPIYYSKGIIKEHLHCRQSASLFDISHLGHIIITGRDRVKLLQRATVGNTDCRTKSGFTQCFLTLLCNERGGILDDAISINLQNQETVKIIANGGTKYRVLKHLQQVISKQKFDANLNLLTQNGFIAVQGPRSVEVMQPMLSQVNLAQVPFMSQFRTKINGTEYIISRSGYTGEDGFQIAAPNKDIANLAEHILKNPIVQLAGLGARDSLRLQAGLCLYQVNPKVTPLEASLMWLVYKRKKTDSRLKFIGEDALNQLCTEVFGKNKKIVKRVGFVVIEPGVIRENCKIFTKDGEQVGQVTSGGLSPTLKKSIGMANIHQDYTNEQTELLAEQRGKRIKIKVCKMPFVAKRYYKGWKHFKDEAFGDILL